MAMEIIAKEKKDIQWKGLPRGHSSTTDRLRGERARLTEQLQKQQEFIGVGFMVEALVNSAGWPAACRWQ